MTQILDIIKNESLEIGTGSGYQSLVYQNFLDLFILLKDIIYCLRRQNLLQSLEINNVFFKHADGGLGWSEQAPFDRIIVKLVHLKFHKTFKSTCR